MVKCTYDVGINGGPMETSNVNSKWIFTLKSFRFCDLTEIVAYSSNHHRKWHEFRIYSVFQSKLNRFSQLWDYLIWNCGRAIIYIKHFFFLLNIRKNGCISFFPKNGSYLLGTISKTLLDGASIAQFFVQWKKIEFKAIWGEFFFVCLTSVYSNTKHTLFII